jgi:hypothetical protein
MPPPVRVAGRTRVWCFRCTLRGRFYDGSLHIWLVTFMHYDLGYFDDETGRLEPIDNPFGPKLLPMSPE